MQQEEWQDALNNSATLYNMLDAAVALVGDPQGSSTDSQPYLIVRCRHIETEMTMQFTFEVPTWLVPVLGSTFQLMESDMERGIPLNEEYKRNDMEDE